MNGVIQPIVVRPATGRRDSWELIAGERRLRAAKLAGLEVIPAVVRIADGMTQAQLALVENIQRSDLNPLDRGLSYQALLDQLGLTQAELAGRARGGPQRDRQPPASPAAARGGAGAGAGREAVARARQGAAGVEDTEEQARLARLAVAQELSVRNLERLTKMSRPRSVARPTGGPATCARSASGSAARSAPGSRSAARPAARGKS